MEFLKSLFVSKNRTVGEVNVVGGGFGDGEELTGAIQTAPAIENPDESIVEIRPEEDINPDMEKKDEISGEEINQNQNQAHQDAGGDVPRETLALPSSNEVPNARVEAAGGETARSTISFTSFQPEGPGVENTARSSGRQSMDQTKARDSRQGASRKTARSSADETPRETTESSEKAENEDDAVEIKFQSVACGHTHTVVITDKGILISCEPPCIQQ